MTHQIISEEYGIDPLHTFERKLWIYDGETIKRVSEGVGGVGALSIPYPRAFCGGLLERYEELLEAGEAWVEPHIIQLRAAIEEFDEEHA